MITTKLRARLLRLGLGLAGLVAIWACNAPFIPVPPPAQAGFTSELVADGNGGQKIVWITHGVVNIEAERIFIFNRDAGSGVITRPQAGGIYQAPPLDGQTGDHVNIYYENTLGERSGTACLLLQVAEQAPLCP